MQPNTHLGIDHALCGAPGQLAPGQATASFTTTAVMAADDKGLVHGGFVFGLADHAAMLAVNDPNVVLGSASTRFLAPVAVGQTVVATARVLEEKGRKRVVEVACRVGDTLVLSGELVCFVLDGHVLG